MEKSSLSIGKQLSIIEIMDANTNSGNEHFHWNIKTCWQIKKVLTLKGASFGIPVTLSNYTFQTNYFHFLFYLKQQNYD